MKTTTHLPEVATVVPLISLFLHLIAILFQKDQSLQNEAYGTLQFYPKNKLMMVWFGNIFSPVFEGDSTGYFTVEWVPGEIEWITLAPKFNTKTTVFLNKYILLD